MNESYKKKSERELIESIFNDDRSRSQKLLELCKQREKKQHLVSVKFGTKSIYLVTKEKAENLDDWKQNKSKQIEKYEKLYN